MAAVGLSVWRHPRPHGAAGRCIGRTDLAVDRRKAKRLAHRIRSFARRHRLPRVVLTSSLQRGRDVGRWLAAWGWTHVVDDRLAELDFGAWDGRPWDAIGAEAMDAWMRDFANHPPGGGETVSRLLQRCAALANDSLRTAACAVGHAGWISAARWRLRHGAAPPTAAGWPPAVGYGERFDWPAAERPDGGAPERRAVRPGGQTAGHPSGPAAGQPAGDLLPEPPPLK